MKDLIDVAGFTTTGGSRFLAATASPAEADAPCVAHARASGARVVGKTNLVELAFGTEGVNPWFGTPRNPRDASLVPGGSSSGSAVAVADGDADVALGTDTGGSVRIPAACCGITGLKPTHGRVPLDGVLPVAPTFDVVGPMATTVDGLVLGMRLLEPGFAVGHGAPRRVARLRVPAESWIDAAIDDALARTRWDVVDVDGSGWLGAWRHAMVALGWEAGRSLAHVLSHLDEIDPLVAERLARSAGTTREEYLAALVERAEWRRELTALFTEFDILAVPSLVHAVPRVDDFRGSRLAATTVQVNSAGVPAVAVPVGDATPVPASVQLVGPWYSDERLLAAALTLEAVAPG